MFVDHTGRDRWLSRSDVQHRGATRTTGGETADTSEAFYEDRTRSVQGQKAPGLKLERKSSELLEVRRTSRCGRCIVSVIEADVVSMMDGYVFDVFLDEICGHDSESFRRNGRCHDAVDVVRRWLS